MEDRPLGYLERVETASVWKSEAGDFVPWLAAPVTFAVSATRSGSSSNR